jgi:predicted small secreted protein
MVVRYAFSPGTAMNQSHKPAILTLALALLFALVATGCNTIRGLGQDTERAGEKIQQQATK